MERGAQPGNTNAANGKEWKEAIRYALAKKGADEEGDAHAHIRGLRKLAMKFVEAAEKGDAWAMKELGDRWDGKPVQGIELGGPDGEPLKAQLNYLPVCPPDK